MASVNTLEERPVSGPGRDSNQAPESLSKFWKTVTGLACLSACLSRAKDTTSCLRDSLCWTANLLVLPSVLSRPAVTALAASSPPNSLPKKVQHWSASWFKHDQAMSNSWAVLLPAVRNCSHLFPPWTLPTWSSIHYSSKIIILHSYISLALHITATNNTKNVTKQDLSITTFPCMATNLFPHTSWSSKGGLTTNFTWWSKDLVTCMVSSRQADKDQKFKVPSWIK